MTSRRKQSPVFSFRDLRAGTINNVAGDQTIITGVGSSLDLEQMRSDLNELRRHLDLEPLSLRDARRTEREIRAIQTELDHPHPHPNRIAPALRRLAETLQSAGALATAGTALAQPIEKLARWLGTAGVPVLAILGIA